jgi:hypothetical protein
MLTILILCLIPAKLPQAPPLLSHAASVRPPQAPPLMKLSAEPYRMFSPGAGCDFSKGEEIHRHEVTSPPVVGNGHKPMGEGWKWSEDERCWYRTLPSVVTESVQVTHQSQLAPILPVVNYVQPRPVQYPPARSGLFQGGRLGRVFGGRANGRSGGVVCGPSG